MEKKLRIVQFLGGLDTGGAEKIVKDYSIFLNKKGHSVLIPVLFESIESPYTKELVDNEISIKVILGKYSKKIHNRIMVRLRTFFFPIRKRLNIIFDSFKPDVIHLHGFVLNYFRNFDFSNSKVFYTCHSKPSDFFSGKWKSQYFIAKKLIDKGKLQLIAINDEMAQDLNSLFSIKSTIVLQNSIDIENFASQNKSKDEVIKKLGIPFNSYIIGNVGRFDPIKNHDFLFKCFEKITSINREAFLLIIGNSNLNFIEKTLQKYLFSKSNRYLILSNREDLFNLYSIMDVFVFPSLYEGFGLAFLEAQISGVRCVVSTNIPKISFVSSKVKALSLNDEVSLWIKEILYVDKKKSRFIKSIKSFDLNSVGEKLLSFYYKHEKS